MNNIFFGHSALNNSLSTLISLRHLPLKTQFEVLAAKRDIVTGDPLIYLLEVSPENVKHLKNLNFKPSNQLHIFIHHLKNMNVNFDDVQLLRIGKTQSSQGYISRTTTHFKTYGKDVSLVDVRVCTTVSMNNAERMFLAICKAYAFKVHNDWCALPHNRAKEFRSRFSSEIL